MKKITTALLWTLSTLTVCYLALCCFFYFYQEKIMFRDTKLPANYAYHFKSRFEELTIQAKDGKKLNGLLFKTDTSKGLIFYLHGIGGNLNKWGKIANIYTDLHYDIFFLDYRSYGKSEGKISDEKQIFSDIQVAYNRLKTIYPESNIVVFGYSFGAGPAARLAADNKPKMLVLQAPYYSMVELGKQQYPFLSTIIPPSLFKYPLRTYEYVEKTKAPIVIFHGSKDSTIGIDESLMLKKFLKPQDTLIIFDGQGHNYFTENPDYIKELKRIF